MKEMRLIIMFLFSTTKISIILIIVLLCKERFNFPEKFNDDRK